MIVEVEQELYEQVEKIVDKMKIDYPSIRNYVNKAVRNQVRIDLITLKAQEKEE